MRCFGQGIKRAGVRGRATNIDVDMAYQVQNPPMDVITILELIHSPPRAAMSIRLLSLPPCLSDGRYFDYLLYIVFETATKPVADQPHGSKCGEQFREVRHCASWCCEIPSPPETERSRGVAGAFAFKSGYDEFCIAPLRLNPRSRRHQLLGFVLLQPGI